MDKQPANRRQVMQEAQARLDRSLQELAVLQVSLREPVEPEVEQPKVRKILVRVTACSPHDPGDKDYYARNGYAGAIYNVAADYRVFPKGTRIRIPGYMDRSFPSKFWEVDSPGGSVIRRSTAKGIPHIDVKFATLHSVKQWGSRMLVVEVLEP